VNPVVRGADEEQVILRFDRVHKRFVSRQGLFRPPRVLQAVRDVSFELRRGEILGVVGESGSGKSTLGRLALRLHPPSEGRIEFDQQDLAARSRRDDAALCRDLQMVFQDPNSALNGRMTIERCLLEPLQIHRIGDRAAQAARIRELLDRVGLPENVLTRYPHELSGGQKQRVVIARALALGPRVLVADEAVAALDASVKAQICNLLLDLREQLGLSILFISHDLPLVQSICDRVLVLYLGEVMEVAPVEQLSDGGRHPYTQALWRSSPVPDPAQRMLEREVIAGEIPSPLAPPSGCVFHTRCPHARPRCTEVTPTDFRPAADVRVRCWLHEAGVTTEAGSAS
jgi:oligopeptide/dipeptide ABC transporter ATP-binding protein